MAVGRGLAPGTVLAGYRVLAPVGRGGTGVVYRARDDRLDRDVALKVVAPRHAADPQVRSLLMRESRLAAGLDHPNVVPVHDAGEADGQVFVAMRFVDGTDLGVELRRGQLSWERALDVAGQVAAALDAAHEHGLVHRDVKPSNVLVDRRGHCYLADFGLGRAAGDPDGDGASLGTVDYVAPEQIRGDAVDGRTDVYALGCMLVELLTGQPPFPRSCGAATLFAHLDEDPPRVHRLASGLPGAVDDVLLRALAKDPAERPARCGDLVDALRHALGLDRPARRRGRRALVAAVAVAVAPVVAATVLVGLRPWAPAPGPSGALVRIAADGTVADRTSVPGYPSAVAVTPRGIWAGDFREGVLWRLDPATGALQRISSPGEPRDLAADGNDVYVASDGPEPLSGNVSRHDAGTGLRTGALQILACALGAGEGGVWAAGCPFVQRLSTDGGALRETSRVLIPFVEPRRASTNRVQVRELAVGADAVWVLGDALDRRVWRLDARTGEIGAAVDLLFPPRSVAVGGGLVWITDPLGDAVVPLDPATGAVLEPVRVGRGAAGVTSGAGAVWVANALDGTVSRIDPAARRVIGTVDVGGSPHELAAGPDGVWVTAWGPDDAG